MNKKPFFVLSLLLIGFLGSCNATNSSQRSYVEPAGGNYDPNRKFKESEPVDLTNLVYEDYCELLPDMLKPWCEREDGCLDPFKDLKPSEITSGKFIGEEGYLEWQEVREGENPFADASAYFYVTRTNWYVDVCHQKQGKYPCFYNHDLSPYDSFGDPSGLYLDAVYSHGVWSYVATYRAGIGPMDLVGSRIIKYLIECTLERFPYSVYFDDKHFYFMSRDIAFPNDYLDIFNKRSDMDLLYA